MRGKNFLGITVVSLALLSTSANAQWAHLEMQSEPGEWIGQGQNWDLWFTPASENFHAEVARVLGNGEPSFVRFDFGNSSSQPNTRSTLDFSSHELNTQLTPGIYLDAQRAVFADPGHPGLDVTYQHRGSSNLTGWFEVESVNYVSDASQPNGWRIEYFRANFEQHSGGSAPALFGQFEYSAVPEPVTGLALLPALLLLRRRKAKLRA